MTFGSNPSTSLARWACSWRRGVAVSRRRTSTARTLTTSTRSYGCCSSCQGCLHAQRTPYRASRRH
ncbi:hypothetical protein DPMN_073453 [Dreissena polymorpha]|uniref:Uncharacterized protein n=1 Tax=Dreissena polymorpha TaxID=45954 RepID=A0A9D4BZ75_DREPO|nr:hypothetical protein DPMN_073453 [Dreissena polymorpha]